ncbi:MAG: carboxy terminal-processing peptidase [Gammaproteobacteria bacterium]|nr:carboxy terminal-processing peptidase [Gammaproteobacteria bacterium]
MGKSTVVARAGLCLLVLLAGGSSGAPAAVGLLPPDALQPSTAQRQLAPRIARVLEERHYSHRPIDDALSAQVADRFLEVLDSQRSYLTAADIAEFARWRTRFDDMIHTGQIDPAYLIFARFRQRNRERLRYAIAQLASEPVWTLEERYQLDREQLPWPRDTQELDELWRQKVKSDGLSLLLTGKSWHEAADILRKRYQRVLQRSEKVTADDVFETLMNAYATAYDPHSNYYSPRSSEEYRIQMSLSYEGIGAQLQLVDDYVTVSGLLPGGAAQAAGTLKVNDRIVAVGQGHDGDMIEVIGWRLDDVVQKIRGRIGTVVRLQILPAGAAPGPDERIIELTRNKVTLEAQAAKKELRQIQDGGHSLHVGIITVPGFYEDTAARRDGDENYRSTTRDVRRLINELKAGDGIDALILDLRGDGGGFLQEATALTGLFIDRGPVVQVRDTDGRVDVLDDPEAGVAWSGPLAVLVDRTSASASEIFAGAIQDYHRGLILGQRTFGKGTVQQMIPLDRWSGTPTQGQVTVTVGKFYRVTGESTQLKGVVPDIELPSAIDVADVGESVLEHALPWDRINPVDFRPLPVGGPSVRELLRAQSVRSATDSDYRWLMQGIESLLGARQQRSLSLNLKQRQRERTAQEQQRLEQENARRSSAGLPAIKTLDEIKAEDLPDVVLSMAAHIAADQVDTAGGRFAAETTGQARPAPPF